MCANSCVNEQVDPNNCGDCGVICAAGQGCQGGTCIPTADAALLTDASGDATTQAEASAASDGGVDSAGDSAAFDSASTQ